MVAIALFLVYGYLAITPFVLAPLGAVVLIGLVYALSALDEGNQTGATQPSDAD